ncbi:MAG: hypothetical protein JWM10_2787 [Myxococcaceae bacterium]|nr:hypothetical protein [Myxococcaceae bacterium]
MNNAITTEQFDHLHQIQENEGSDPREERCERYCVSEFERAPVTDLNVIL